MKHLKEIWRLLGISIYEGKRYKQNLRTFAIIAFFLETPALLGMFLHHHTRYWALSLGCLVLFVSNLFVIYLALVKKNREVLVKYTVCFSVILCTVIALFARNGFASHWTLVFPLIICYLCGVRIGLVSSSYLACLFILLYFGIGFYD